MPKSCGGLKSLHTDCIVPVPTPQSGHGSFGNTVDAQKPTAQPVKPVQFADVTNGSAGNKGFGAGSDNPGLKEIVGGKGKGY